MHDVRTIGGYGPWSPTVSSEERGRQLRCMSALAYVYLGPSHPLWSMLRAAEVDPVAFVEAQELIEAMPPLWRRRLFATFSRVTWGARS